MSSPEKQWLVQFFKGSDFLLSSLEFDQLQRAWEEGINETQIRGRLIKRSNVANYEEYRDFEAENKWTPPAVSEFNPDNPGYQKFLKARAELLRNKRI